MPRRPAKPSKPRKSGQMLGPMTVVRNPDTNRVLRVSMELYDSAKKEPLVLTYADLGPPS